MTPKTALQRPARREVDVSAATRGRTLSYAAAGAVAALITLTACAVGPNYQRPTVALPEQFKEGVEWQRASADPQGAMPSAWWVDYSDPELTRLIEEALKANQGIAVAEANYRLALATVAASQAALYPTVGVGVSGTRSQAAATGTIRTLAARTQTLVSATASAGWEPDLWGQIRRNIEASRASAEATDAELAGERLSIASSVAIDYFTLRQADMDIALLHQQQTINARLLAMSQAGFAQGANSADAVLTAQDSLQLVLAELQSTQTTREQTEHALATLTGVPPNGFAIKARSDYAFSYPEVPLVLPSQLLERRYDVVNAERLVVAANAKIGVAKAAFFPTLDLSAEGGFQHNQLATLFSIPNRFWALGPTLAETLFDGGARIVAVRQAQATYEADVATYRQAVLSALQSVEDSLSSINHLKAQADSYEGIYQRSQKLFESEQAQFAHGTVSEQSLLTQQLTLLLAEQAIRDAQASLTQSTVTLISNLGGGWQWNNNPTASTAVSLPFLSNIAFAGLSP